MAFKCHQGSLGFGEECASALWWDRGDIKSWLGQQTGLTLKTFHELLAVHCIAGAFSLHMIM